MKNATEPQVCTNMACRYYGEKRCRCYPWMRLRPETESDEGEPRGAGYGAKKAGVEAIYAPSYRVVSAKQEDSVTKAEAIIAQHAAEHMPKPAHNMFAREITKALSESGFMIVKVGTKCPFGKNQPDPGLDPTDPCPVCGDLGTMDAADGPSHCIG